MNITTLRNTFGPDIEHLSDEVIDSILFLTHPAMRRPDDSFLEYLRCWIVAESFIDAAEELELDFDSSRYDDLADAEEAARDKIIDGGFEYFTTEDHEVVVLALD